jgi:acyl transferase domain-containing protein/thioesterase domain-containing protein/acyl carrier protein
MSSDNDNTAALDTDIAVVGMAGRFAGARSIDEYWNNLRNGVESLSPFTEAELTAAGVNPAELADPNYVKVGAVLPDMEEFDAKFFGFSPREASIMDPQHRHFLEVAWEALENAGHVPEKFDGSIGIFGGSGHNAYMPRNLMSNPKLMASVGFFLVRHTGNDKDFLTTRVSYLLNLRGPSVNVQTACSTSLVAIHSGVQSLLNGECDMALAGGVTIELPHRHGYLYRENEILSPDGHCRAFDAASKGTVFGSGAGVVVLRRLADAIADGDHIHAVIKGSAVNNDGSQKVGYMAPSVDGQAQAIAEAMAIANVSPETITYVSAHGTGTPVGDPIEVAALTQAYRQGTEKTGYCALGSVKTNIGHTDTAAGVASFIAVAKAMQAGEIPPLLHFKSGNPACDFERTPFYLNAERIAWMPPQGVPRRAGVSSLGVGGTNAHIVVEQAPRRGPSGVPTRRLQVLVQSARSMKSLDAGSQTLAAFFKSQPDVNFADAAYTLQVGRQAMQLRRVVVAESGADAGTALLDTERVITETAADVPRSVAFMFAGGGAQHPNMGRGLYDSEPVYRRAVDECLNILQSRLKVDLKPLLFPAAGQEDVASEQLQRPSLALPALLTTQYAQAKLWQSWGVEPNAMIGHSMGEYTAAHLAGVFSLADSLTLVELRGRLFESLPEGAMLSVPLPEAELLPLLPADLSIGVINGPRLCVASGPVASIEALQARLAEMEIDAARVRINVAAHSPMLEPILGEFHTFLRGITMRAPTIPLVSNFSGKPITAAEATSPDYWVRHLRHTVRFADGVQELLADESRVLLEVGPGRTLSSLARNHPARKMTQPIVTSMRHPDEAVHDQAFMLGAFGRLWAVGTDVDWSKLREGETRHRIELPTYRFDHQRHWVEPGVSGVLAPEDRPLHKRKDLSQWFYQPVWQRSVVQHAVVAHTGTAPRRTLVLSDGSGLADRLAQRLRDAGDEVIVALAGKAWREVDARNVTVDAKSAHDIDRLFEKVLAVNPPPSRIVHLWNLGAADVESTLQRGFYRLLQVAQIIGREDLSEPMALMVVTQRAQRVAGETDLDPAKATLLGPCKVIPREFPNVRCLLVDVDAPSASSPLERRLLDGMAADLDAALATAPMHDVIAWRAGERWVQEQAEAPLPAVAPGQSRLRTQGVYLITGGLGGVGLALAEYLAKTVQARLVLVGRQGLPPRSEWPHHLANGGASPSLVQRIRQVMAIEALGAEVLVIAADVTQAPQMKAAVKQARARFGALHGVLHTAGVLADGVIQLKDASVAASVLAPKVQGTLALEAALADDKHAPPLDFLMLFSSISAFAGLAGQIDYAAANAFLDATAQARHARGEGHTIAVDWSQWQEVGMAAELANQLGLAPDALSGEDGVEIGHPLAQRLLIDTRDERVVATRLSRATHWLLEEHQVKGGEALIPGTGYLEIVRNAFALRGDGNANSAIELRNVTFLAPFVVRAGEERDLRVHLRGLGTPTASFTVVGRTAGEAFVNDAWTEHVRGQVARVADGPKDTDSVAAISQRCQQRTQDAATTPEHLLFGARWNNIHRLQFGNGEALLTLELPAAFAPDLAEFPLHPALMDMATGGAQALVPGYDESRDFFVPALYGSVRIHGALTPQLTSHVRWRADLNDDDGGTPDLAPDLAHYDVTIRDASGRIVVEVEDFTMLRVRDKALLAHPATAATPAPARPRATANNVLALGLRDGILSAEGAEVIERVLAADAGPQIVVSPQDLIALLAKLRQTAAPVVAAQTESAEAMAGYKAPSTATEKMIAQMWAEMLGHARVSATDNFFDLGGHSLLAVQVINKLKKRIGKALPLTALLEAPTVETLAALINPQDTARADNAAAGAATDGVTAAPSLSPVIRSATLVPVRPASGKPPLFFVHDGMGETLLYRNLALKLEPGHPVYGIQPEINARGEYAQTTVRDWAAAHIRTLRRVQPQGPYMIAGLCAGGVIAVEMARQLQEAGERTSYVGILDAADSRLQEIDHVKHARRDRLMRLFTQDGNGGRPTPLSVLRALPSLFAKGARAARYELNTRWTRWVDARKVRRMRDQAEPHDMSESQAPTVIPYLQLYEHAHREHDPGTQQLQGLVALYRAQKGDGTPADQPYLERYGEPLLGWGRRVASPLEVADVPGGHASLLQEPNVQKLAEAMNQHLVRALDSRAGAPAAAPFVERRARPRNTAPLPAPQQTADIEG